MVLGESDGVAHRGGQSPTANHREGGSWGKLNKANIGERLAQLGHLVSRGRPSHHGLPPEVAALWQQGLQAGLQEAALPERCHDRRGGVRAVLRAGRRHSACGLFSIIGALNHSSFKNTQGTIGTKLASSGNGGRFVTN